MTPNNSTAKPTGTMAQALIAWHKTNPVAPKNGSNPHFRSSFSTLEDVITCVNTAAEFGLTFAQANDFIITEQGGVVEFIETIMMHESGDSVHARTLIKVKDATNPQSMGSGITYAKRYGLQAMFGIASEDDDGNNATGSDGKQTLRTGIEKGDF